MLQEQDAGGGGGGDLDEPAWSCQNVTRMNFDTSFASKA